MRQFAELIAGLLALLFAHAAAAQPADTLFVNGRIVTLDRASRITDSLAVQSGRIVAVGQRVEARRIVDLGGRTVIPGLIDSHIHAIRAGVTYAQSADWSGVRTIPEAMARLAAAAKASPPDRWLLVAGGWTEQQFAEQRRPSQSEIMAAAPGRAVFVQLSYRAALLSPEAFQRLGIAADSDIPPNGRIEHDADGVVTGWINGDGTTLIRLFDRLPRPTLDQAKAGTRAFFRELNSLGMTGVLDPGGHNLPGEDYAALFALQREGKLTLRVAYSLFAPRPGHELEDFKMLTRFLPMGLASGDGMLVFNGIGECVTWGMYNNDHPTAAQKDEYYQVARWAAENGLTLTQHWNSDASVDNLLEVFERVNREIPIAPLRWSIAHLHDANPATLARMKELGVGWLMQDGLHFATASFLNARAQTLARIPPIASAIRIELPTGGGTDADRVMSYNPFVSLQWMVDGRTVGGRATRGPGETPSLEQALRLYTQGSAWFSRDDDRRGSLEAGKEADLAVLSRDIFTVPTAEIGKTRSLLTMVGGRIVYAAAPFAALEESAKP